MRTLNSAYAAGLMSDDTFTARLDLALSAGLLDANALVGDLNLGRAGSPWTKARARLATWWTLARDPSGAHAPTLLALDWSGAETELVIGRHPACDLVLESSSVSRQHAQLAFRDHNWIIQDLGSTNGTIVNGTRVGRCLLHAGDSLRLGDERLRID